MAEQKNYVSIEDAIDDLLGGENKINALDWVEFVRTNGFATAWNPEHKQLRIESNGRVVSCSYVDVGGADIIVNFCTRDFDNGSPASDGLKEFTLSHVVVCPQGCDGQEICERSQKDVKIFGKEYANICISPLMLINPGTKDFGYAKELILRSK